MNADFFQLGYVTNDFDHAIRELRALHSIGPFKEMRDTHLPTRPGYEAIAHFGLAFKGDLQFEVIAPTSGDIGIYREAMPVGQPGMRLHHLGRHLGSPCEYHRLLESHAARWAMPIRCAAFGGFFAYADARSELGHYVEIFTFPGDFFADVPRY